MRTRILDVTTTLISASDSVVSEYKIYKGLRPLFFVYSLAISFIYSSWPKVFLTG